MCFLFLRPNLEGTLNSKKKPKTAKKINKNQKQSPVEQNQSNGDSRYVGCFTSESSFLGILY